MCAEHVDNGSIDVFPACFNGFDFSVQRFVDGHRNADRPRLFNQGAREEIDFGQTVSLGVLSETGHPFRIKSVADADVFLKIALGDVHADFFGYSDNLTHRGNVAIAHGAGLLDVGKGALGNGNCLVDADVEHPLAPDAALNVFLVAIDDARGVKESLDGFKGRQPIGVACGHPDEEKTGILAGDVRAHARCGHALCDAIKDGGLREGFLKNGFAGDAV